MKRIFQLLAAIFVCMGVQAQKKIYVPKDLQQMDLMCDTSLWSYTRMQCTDNFAIMWQRGFGYDLSCLSPNCSAKASVARILP